MTFASLLSLTTFQAVSTAGVVRRNGRETFTSASSNGVGSSEASKMTPIGGASETDVTWIAAIRCFASGA